MESIPGCNIVRVRSLVFSKEEAMFSQRRLLAGAIVSALAVEWIFIALASPNGFLDLARFTGPAALVSVATVWVFFTFAGNLFTWTRAIKSVVICAALTTPILTYFLSASNDPNLVSKFIFMVTVAWAASLGGTLWSLAGSVHDAFKEWRIERRNNSRRRIYVPA
jgi:hypothetical protein